MRAAPAAKLSLVVVIVMPFVHSRLHAVAVGKRVYDISRAGAVTAATMSGVLFFALVEKSGLRVLGVELV